MNFTCSIKIAAGHSTHTHTQVHHKNNNNSVARAVVAVKLYKVNVQMKRKGYLWKYAKLVGGVDHKSAVLVIQQCFTKLQIAVVVGGGDTLYCCPYDFIISKYACVVMSGI